MICELPQRDFERVLPLYDESRYVNIEPWAIIQGHNPGRAFVDNTERPTTVLVWSQGMEGFYLLGNPNNWDFNKSLAKFLDMTIAPEARELGYPSCEISGGDPGWNPVIETVLADQCLSSWQQSVYLYPRTQQKPGHPALPAGFRLVKAVDMLRADAVSQDSLLGSAIQRYWTSQGVFSQHGGGYCALYQGEIASVCYVSFRTYDTNALGIETVKEHRQKGLGRATAAATLREVLAEAKRPYWDCSADNLASAATARGVGLEKAWEYTCHGYPL